MYFCDLHRIEYKEKAKWRNYYKEIHMPQKSACDWNINDEVVELMKKTHFEHRELIHSFDNRCWVLCIVPTKAMPTRHFVLAVKLLALPHAVIRIKVKMTFYIQPNISLVGRDEKI